MYTVDLDTVPVLSLLRRYTLYKTLPLFIYDFDFTIKFILVISPKHHMYRIVPLQDPLNERFYAEA